MEITDFEAIPIEVDVIPLGEEYGIAPYVTNHGEVETAKRMIIKLSTREGITGWGEMMVEVDPVAIKTLLDREIAPAVIGRSVWDIESLKEEFFYYYVDIESLLGAVEMAMWDALGKYLQAPLHQLLGGKRMDTVPFAYCLGILDQEPSREHARFAAEQGFPVLKTKGGRDWRHDVDRMTAMHDEVGDELEFRLDPNQGWSFDEAVRLGAMLEDRGVYPQYLEQPVRIETYGTYKRLRQRLRLPIAANDDTYFARNLYHLVTHDAIDVAVVDLVPLGILGTKRAAGVAGDAGISLTHHCGFDLGIKTAAVLHMVASTPRFNLPPDTVYYALDDDVIESPFEFSDGSLPVPDRPGLGVTVRESKIEAHRIDK